MSKSKARPSFAPPAAPTPASSATGTGWVYRTDQSEKSGAPDAAAPSKRWLDVVTLPLSLSLIAALQPFGWIDRRKRSRALLLACVLMAPTAALAQTPGAVSTQIGTITEQTIMRPPAPWMIQVGGSGDIEEGNSERTQFGGNALFLRDWSKWRFASTVAAGHETANNKTTVERYSFDLALARTLSEKWRAVFINDYARSPFDGLAHQNATGGMMVWLPDSPEKLGLGLFGGAAYAMESYTLPGVEDQNFVTTMAGASATYFFTRENTLAMLFTHALDLSDQDNYRLGGRLALNTRVVGGLGLQVAYEVGYDHEPVAHLEDLQQTVTLGLTYRITPRPPAKPPVKP